MNLRIAIFLTFVLLLKATLLASQDIELDNYENYRAEMTDEELENEMRRRNIEGPWSPEDTFAILNTAIDSLSNKTGIRRRQYAQQAQELLALLTGYERPVIEQEPMEVDNEEYEEEAIRNMRGEPVKESTMRTILRLLDGTDETERRSYKAVSKLYPWMHPNYVPRFRARLAGNSITSKHKVIDELVFARFQSARQKLQPIHGNILRRWGRQEASKLGIPEFKASQGWLTRFKKRHGIVSRKVTNYVGRAESARAPEIAASIIRFRDNYLDRSSGFEHKDIWNFDQTGFNYEPTNLRTLSFKGERDTELALDSKNKMSHSYTAQPLIRRDGRLYNKLLLLMQERDGVFGKHVQQDVEELEHRFGNVEVYASSSGKFTTKLMNHWYNTTIRQAVTTAKRGRVLDDDEPAVLLLMDTFGGQSSAWQIGNLSRMGVESLLIPPSTTDRLQPLDINYNRQYKKLYNRVAQEAFYEDILANITSRTGIINLQSLIHDQFSSPAYRDMILYAWRHTDLRFNISELSTFDHSRGLPRMVSDINFNFDETHNCTVSGCDKPGFIKCSHCGRILCVHHFLARTCFHHQQTRSKRSTSDIDDQDVGDAWSHDETSDRFRARQQLQHSRSLTPDSNNDGQILSKLEQPILKAAELGCRGADIIGSSRNGQIRASSSNPDRISKPTPVQDGVFSKFLAWIKKKKLVRSSFLRRWALLGATKRGIDNFNPSSSWLSRFKRKYNILTKKFSKDLTKAHLKNLGTNLEKILKYKKKFSRWIKFFRKLLTFNVDMVDFDLAQMRSPRSLDTVDSHRTYSTFPTISNIGQLAGKLMIIYPESTGTFSESTAKSLADLEYKYGNVKMYASYNGRVNGSIVRYKWLPEVFMPTYEKLLESKDSEAYPIPWSENRLKDEGAGDVYDDDNQCEREVLQCNNCERLTWPGNIFCENLARKSALELCRQPPEGMLIHDNWNGSHELMFGARTRGIKPLEVPENISPDLQPLDGGFRQQYKLFVSRIVDQARNEFTLDKLVSREGLLNLHSLVWNQFSSPIYHKMLKSCWQALQVDAEQEEDHNRTLNTMRAVQFSFKEPTCSVDTCNEESFIRCSHCGRTLCLRHFLERYCYHDPDKVPAPPIDMDEAFNILGDVEENQDEEVLDAPPATESAKVMEVEEI